MTGAEQTPGPGSGGPGKGNKAGLMRAFMQKTHAFLSSVELALALLVIILVCCVTGVTVYRGVEAGARIFGTLWFNGILVLLVVNVVFCFFGRIWGRKVTLISLGMILFHLSFVAMLGGIIYNSLFFFRGAIRLTEGESLPSGQLESYDAVDYGRYFDLAGLKGTTTLVKLHPGYQLDGASKRVAYEVALGKANERRGIIYTTRSLDLDGFSYFNDREGYTLLIVLLDNRGKELYGAYVPLQSLKQKNEAFLYTTGTKESAASMPFPQGPEKPVFDILVTYRPVPIRERSGYARFTAWPLSERNGERADKPIADREVEIGRKLKIGDHYVMAKEVRYWASMNVRHEPGQPVVLTSLWIALGGMVMTFIGRMRRG